MITPALIGLAIGLGSVQVGGALITSFESQADLAKVVQSNVTVSLTTGVGVTDGRSAAKIRFARGPWPNITFRVGKGFASGDWRQYGAVDFDVTNLDDSPVYLATRIDDDPSADGRHHCRTGWAYLPMPPHKTITVEATFDRAPGMRLGPTCVVGAVPSTQDGPVGEPLDWSHIVAFEIWLPGPDHDATLVIDNVRLVPKPDLRGIVDRYGQYTREDWPGKVHTDADFGAQLRDEEAWLKAHPPLPDRDEYGGWAGGPTLRATGYFRTAYVAGGKEIAPPAVAGSDGGRWWLVTPSGHLFFSDGIDGVGWPGEGTQVTGRDAMFAWMPGKDDPLVKFAQIRADRWVNFRDMNLRRKLGADWQAKEAGLGATRLLAWGFNTLGDWSGPEVRRLHRLPYTVPIHYWWMQGWDRVPLIPTSVRDMPDMFDPVFARVVEAGIADVVKQWAGDPWCLGYFVDNELPWAAEGDTPAAHYDLPRSVLKLAGTFAAKRVFTDRLRAKYADIARLNEAWGTKIASWGEFEAKPVMLGEKMTEACQADLSDLLSLFARRHFEFTSSIIRKLAPHQLILGSRFSSYPPEAVAEAAKFCDVVSFNRYGHFLPHDVWAFTSKIGKPCLIGEFQMGALDRGMWNVGCAWAMNQADRGRHYQAYVRSVWALPAFVGCHWFQYHDEPLTGRWDGENYNNGFVSIVDEPYWELVDAAREIHAETYTALTRAR